MHVATHGCFLPDQPLAPEDRDRPLEMSLDFGAARGLARLRGTVYPLLRSGIAPPGADAAGEEASTITEDGWVTAEDIAQRELRRTELVVLSACQSGVGEVRTGKGVHRLRRAFRERGSDPRRAA